MVTSDDSMTEPDESVGDSDVYGESDWMLSEEEPLEQSDLIDIVFNVRGHTFECGKALIKHSAYFSLLLEVGDGPFDIDRDPIMFDRVMQFIKDPQNRHMLLQDEGCRQVLMNELDYYAVISRRRMNDLIAVCALKTDQKAMIDKLARVDPSLDVSGFIGVFQGILERTDLGPFYTKVMLNLLMLQARLYLMKRECEERYVNNTPLFPRDEDGEVVDLGIWLPSHKSTRDYNTSVKKRDTWENCAHQDTIEWFKNPDFVNQKDSERFSMPMPASVSWLTLDIATLTTDFHKMTEVAEHAHFDVDSYECECEDPIAALFYGTAGIKCYAMNDRADVIRLMYSVLYHVPRLMEACAAEKADWKACNFANRVRDHFHHPYSAHLDMIYGVVHMDDEPSEEEEDEDEEYTDEDV